MLFLEVLTRSWSRKFSFGYLSRVTEVFFDDLSELLKPFVFGGICVQNVQKNTARSDSKGYSFHKYCIHMLLGYRDEFDETTKSQIFMHPAGKGTKSSLTTLSSLYWIASWRILLFSTRNKLLRKNLLKVFSYLLRPKFPRLLWVILFKMRLSSVSEFHYLLLDLLLVFKGLMNFVSTLIHKPIR